MSYSPQEQFVQSSATFHGTNATGTIVSNAISVSVANATNSSLSITAGNGSSIGNLSQLYFSNANGVSFGLSTSNNGSATLTGTVQTNYLTTAMASNRGSDFVQATANFAGTNATGTIASDGISVSVAPITNSSWTVSDANTSATVGRLAFTNVNGLTLSLSTSNNGNHTVIGSYTVPVLTNSSLTMQAGGSTLSSVSRVNFGDANGISFLASTSNNGSITISANHALQFTSNTSAITSNAVNTSNARIQAIAASNTTYTSGSVTFRDTNGISWQSTTGQQIQITHALQYTSNMTDYQSTGAYLTTAAQSTQTFLASLGGNSGTTNSSRIGNGGFVFAGGNGVTINQSNNSVSWSVATNYQSQGAYLTTAAQSTQTNAFTLSGNSATTNSSVISAGGYAFAGGNGVTLQQSNNTVSWSVATNYRASTDAVGLNTAQTNVTWTVNSSGLSLNAAGYAGTVASGHNATLTLNSSGVTVSVAPPGAAAEANWVNLLGANTSGNTSASGSTIGWSGINLTLSGTNNSVINISAPATSSLSATGALSISANGSTISMGVPIPELMYWDNMGELGQGIAGSSGTINIATRATVQNTVHIFPIGMLPGSIAANTIMFQMSHSASGNSSSAPKVFSISFGIYTRNVSTLSLLNSGSTAISLAANAANSTGYSGIRWISMHSSLFSVPPTFSASVEYYGALVYSTGGNNSAAQTAGFLGYYPFMTANNSGVFGVSQTTGSTQGFHPWLGVWSSTGAIPTAIQIAHVTKQGASANFVPHIIFNNLTSYF